MTAADLQKARKRLEQVKHEVLWAIAVLEDPTTLKGYTLTQDEKEEVIQECHTKLAEIQMAITRVLSQEIQITVESKTRKIVGPVPPWLERMVGPITPHEDNVDIVGSITPHEDNVGIAGPITPHEDKDLS